ncbi:MAG TPA: hypothetical protein VK272_13025 [Solirubrobacteraceae bacterium]|nr:hypothetical protein [Solirubrobacteraceae bacterium]
MARPYISGAGGISPRAARAAGAAGFISKDWQSPLFDSSGTAKYAGLGLPEGRMS